ncbi:hypothetical protein HanRHA438_Chr02g0084281 [Helianthus annuus]|nr:hypothetical protein HanIR_Chr02g0085281 [Helianthus annuus]KAJ0940515.1 hypothetical protein HanRHA438_Chr02g0084281 [Helianthus annuus]
MSKLFWVPVPNFSNRNILSTNSIPTFGVPGTGSLPFLPSYTGTVIGIFGISTDSVSVGTELIPTPETKKRKK